ncbi:MAG: TRAP transporter large permease subunit [Deltaproteobacteria bacterium]|nr:TRAP transporter large permease subunit [Deltaproteobacteria bacterium]
MYIAIGIIVLAMLGVPLFAVFGSASMALFLSRPEGTWASVGIDVFGAKFADSPSLMMIPLFTFAGYMLAEAKTPFRLVRVSRAWFGWMPGSLAMVCLGTSAFFTTFTGGSGVTIVAVGGLLFPALLSEKYPERFSLGIVTTGGSLGLLFPPSVPLIMYGIIASLAGAGLIMNKVLVAGIIPGLVVMIVLGIYGAIIGMQAEVSRTKFDIKEALASLWEIKWEAIIPVFLVGGLILGLFRIHEASAFTAVYVLIIEVFVYRDIRIRKDLPRIIVESMVMVGAILAILSTAIGFTGWMVQAQISDILIDWVETIISSKWAFLLVINLFLLMVGMLMDIFTAIMVVVPLIIPIADAYGIDPYHMAIIFLLNLEIGYLTPPLGINLFISGIRFNKPITYVYRTVLPFIGVLFVALLLVTYIPSLTMWLVDKVQAEGEEMVSVGGGGEEDLAADFLDEEEQPTAEEQAEDAGTDSGSEEKSKMEADSQESTKGESREKEP